MGEKRQSSRHRTLKGAQIAFQEGHATIQCIVRNLSDTGACLAVESPIGIPNTFSLVFDGPEPDRTCRVMWRTKDRIGVEFT
jgi:hypothetical protein